MSKATPLMGPTMDPFDDIKSMPVVRDADLVKRGCREPGCMCEVMVLRAACHPNAPVFAAYHQGLGRLAMKCAICGEPIAAVQVRGTGVLH